MKLSQKILAEISQITSEIVEKFPELQKYLNELPITLSDNKNMGEKIDDNLLKEYLENLKSIVKKYKSEH